MNNPDIILVILLGILIYSLFNSNKELFDLQAQFKKMYPMFSPNSQVNSAKHNLDNAKLKIFNNILDQVKFKLNKKKTKNPYTIDYLESTKKTRKLPETTIIAKMIVKRFNKQRKNHKVSLKKVTAAYAELHNNVVSLTYDMNLDYTIKQNKTYTVSGFQKNQFENFIVVRVVVFFPLTPKPDLSKMFIDTLESKELANYKYLPGDQRSNNYPFERNLSNKIVYSKKKIKTLLEQRKLIAAQDNRKKKKKKDKKKQQKKTERFINKKKSTLTNFLLNSPKAREQKKETFFVNNSLSETIFNPPTEDINDYFSFME